ncbi:MAG: glutamine--fructose-6-phosphate transaminase (isomerizing), partial [Spirochaetes bacterium]|nr:glutamine--fructose-6-phosphate transaminase (isomerizing) [Spirochaetota bacterium]
MCGIVGYVGNKECSSILVQGLRRLEYRGYDSSGISILDSNEMVTYKKKGKIIEMENILPNEIKGNIGIGHTRWATHGKVTDQNAHPHLSHNKKVSIVHNGIIENYRILKTKLEEEGLHFCTETDSEVIAHLIELNLQNHSFEEAFYQTVNLLEGTFGIAAICIDHPDQIMIARKGSPLVLGIGNEEMFVASDVNAFLGFTKQVVYLEDNEIAILNKKDFQIRNLKLDKIDKDIKTIDWDIDAIEKNGYSDYMLKEIFEQPESIKRAFAGRFIEDIGTAKLGGLNMTPQELFNIERIRIIACGTSYHAGLIGAIAIEELARINTSVEIASELRYKNPIIDKNT